MISIETEKIHQMPPPVLGSLQFRRMLLSHLLNCLFELLLHSLLVLFPHLLELASKRMLPMHLLNGRVEPPLVGLLLQPQLLDANLQRVLSAHLLDPLLERSHIWHIRGAADKGVDRWNVVGCEVDVLGDVGGDEHKYEQRGERHERLLWRQRRHELDVVLASFDVVLLG